MLKQFFPFLLIIFLNLGSSAQSTGTKNLWHEIERTLRYHPEGPLAEQARSLGSRTTPP
jgi:hypothetical protein